MFNTRNELLNLVGMVSMSLICLDPNGTIDTADEATHNNLYSLFTYSASVVVPGGFAGNMMIFYDDEED